MESQTHKPQSTTPNEVPDPLRPSNYYKWYGVEDGWGEVGKLSVKVYCARGLHSIFWKPDVQCELDLDNVKYTTRTEKGTTDPNWNETFTLVPHLQRKKRNPYRITLLSVKTLFLRNACSAVNDITSTLEISVLDDSFIHIYVCMGKLSIPLLRITNDVKRWYILKGNHLHLKRNILKKKCPRILLAMTIVWNPIKASLRVMTPKEVITKSVLEADFNVTLIYYDLKFITDVFHYIRDWNEYYKVPIATFPLHHQTSSIGPCYCIVTEVTHMFEWDSRMRSAAGLAAWITFWIYFKVWIVPNLALAIFLYYMAEQIAKGIVTSDNTIDENVSFEDLKPKESKTYTQRLKELKDVTLTTKNGIDYIVGHMERVKNLVMCRVPYLSYLAMLILVALSLAIYIVPYNYLFMALGIFKFTRKQINKKRVPNNDLLDFLSRIPDDLQLKQWRELRIPEHLIQNS